MLCSTSETTIPEEGMTLTVTIVSTAADDVAFQINLVAQNFKVLTFGRRCRFQRVPHQQFESCLITHGLQSDVGMQ